VPPGRLSSLLVAVAAAALMAGCATTVSVATDFDRAVDFSRFHTFSFVGGHLTLNGIADEGNTIVKDRIRNAVVAALGERGLAEASDHPDLVVGYWAGARTRTEIEGMPPYAPEMGPYWTGGWWGPGYTQWWTRTYDEGTLVIDLVDAASHRLVWRAYARTEIKPPVDDKRVREIVERAFKDFPPRP
jgi:hypothetical protein